jgi:hypothetical protein
MKQLFYFLLGIVLLSSCDDSMPVTSDDVVNARVRAVLDMPAVQDRKLAYSLLNKEEKSVIWRTHISTEMSKVAMTEDQREVAEDAVSFISSADFDETELVDSKVFKDLQDRVREKFDVPTRIKIFGNLGPMPKTEGPPPNCSCATQSNYCSPNKFCGSAQCTTTPSGCGTFWLYSCDGQCRLADVN